MKANLFIVGVPKSATTTLYSLLSQHYDVSMSKIKEPHFFDTDITLDMYPNYLRRYIENRLKVYNEIGKEHFAFVRDYNLYKSLFENPEAKILGEATPYYSFSRVAIQNIYRYNPSSRIILMLRNPVDRAWSHYLMDYRQAYINIGFREKIKKDILRLEQVSPTDKLQDYRDVDNYVSLGLYSYQLERVFNVFSKSQVLVILFEEFIKNPELYMSKIFEFLGLSKIKLDLRKENESKLPRNRFSRYLIKVGKYSYIGNLIPHSLKAVLKPFVFKKGREEITPDDRKYLESIFKEDILKTSEILNKDLFSIWKM